MKAAHVRVAAHRTSGKAATTHAPLKRSTRPRRGPTSTKRRPIVFALDPEEMELERLARVIQDALAARRTTLRQALKNLDKVRKERFARLYGKR
jgi:hypothetical protein